MEALPETIKLRRRRRWVWLAICALFGLVVVAAKLDFKEAAGIAAVLILPALLYGVLLGMRIRRAEAVNRPPQKLALAKAIVTAVLLCLFDVFFSGWYVFSALIGIAAIMNLLEAYPLRKDHPALRAQVHKAVAWLVIGALSIAVVRYDAGREEERAHALIAAVQQFHAKYQRYPATLPELVPEFLAEIPAPRLAAAAGKFMYRGGPADPTLMYVVMPPYGRKTYRFATGEWGEID